MNDTDRLRDAQKLDDAGVDPDKVMVTYTLEEYAQSHGEEVDTFDVDKASLEQITAELEGLDQERQEVEKDIMQIRIILDTEDMDHTRRQELSEEMAFDKRKLSEIESQYREYYDTYLKKQEQFENEYGSR